MSLDISGLNIERQESILAAVLFCDWNIRAWTMLEALRGRTHIEILFRDNKTVRFLDILRSVSASGRLDIAVFGLLLPHMVPRTLNLRSRGGWEDVLGDPHDIPFETIGTWLSHRPTSRKSDNVRIWALCINERSDRVKNPAEFWAKRKWVSTGFLLSSAGRHGAKGLSWAPVSPFSLPDGEEGKHRIKKFYRPPIGMDTELARIWPEGLWGKWWVHETKGKRSRDSAALSPQWLLRAIHKTENMLWTIRKHLQIQGTHMAILRPKSFIVHGPQAGADLTTCATKSGVLVAVCDSEKDEEKSSPKPTEAHLRSHRWIWRGVYEWPTNVPLPVFIYNPGFWIA